VTDAPSRGTGENGLPGPASLWRGYALAGTNKVLQEGQVLFKAGDTSDGMYLIRKGEMRVYLEQDGKEVTLATVGEGGMIGEMALFDKQPRSASVKATKESEVTLISLDDFGKLMKQIPKWFVGLMSALSSRLRTTNDRLKNLESNGAAAGPAADKGRPYQAVLRQLNVIGLLWHRDGEKDGKDSTLRRVPMEQALTELFNENPQKLQELLAILIKQKMLSVRQDAYKNQVLVLANRAALTQVVTFINAFVKGNPKKAYLTAEAVDIILVLEKLVLAAPYDASTVPLSDLAKEGKRAGKVTTNWEKEITSLQKVGEEVKLVKTSTGVGLKASKKDIAHFARHCELLAELYKANLM